MKIEFDKLTIEITGDDFKSFNEVLAQVESIVQLMTRSGPVGLNVRTILTQFASQAKIPVVEKAVKELSALLEKRKKKAQGMVA